MFAGFAWIVGLLLVCGCFGIVAVRDLILCSFFSWLFGGVVMLLGVSGECVVIIISFQFYFFVWVLLYVAMGCARWCRVKCSSL